MKRHFFRGLRMALGEQGSGLMWFLLLPVVLVEHVYDGWRGETFGFRVGLLYVPMWIVALALAWWLR